MADNIFSHNKEKLYKFENGSLYYQTSTIYYHNSLYSEETDGEETFGKSYSSYSTIKSYYDHDNGFTELNGNLTTLFENDTRLTGGAYSNDEYEFDFDNIDRKTIQKILQAIIIVTEQILKLVQQQYYNRFSYFGETQKRKIEKHENDLLYEAYPTSDSVISLSFRPSRRWSCGESIYPTEIRHAPSYEVIDFKPRKYKRGDESRKVFNKASKNIQRTISASVGNLWPSRSSASTNLFNTRSDIRQIPLSSLTSVSSYFR